MKTTVSNSDMLMAATILDPDSGKVRVVTIDGTEEIVIGNRHYVPQRTKAGGIKKNDVWLPKWSQTSHEL